MSKSKRGRKEGIKQAVYKQMNEVTRIAECLKETVWNNKYFSKDSKVKTYKTVVRHMIYTGELRTDTQKNKTETENK